MADFANLKCGKLAPRVDPRTLKMSSYLASASLPPLPASCDWTKKVQTWGTLKNDELGDCAEAAPAHQIMAMTAEALGTAAAVTDEQVVAAYSAITGYRPGDPSTDNGSVYLDVMNYWRMEGFAGHRAAAYVGVNAKDPDQVRYGSWLAGGLQLGVQLPAAAKDQLAAGQPWTAPLDPKQARGQWAPGSWGGHAIPILGWDDHGLTCVTWGKLQRLSWQFLAVYGDEAYIAIEADWFSPNGRAPSGFDLYTLWDDLQSITDGRVPVPPPPPRPVPVTPPSPKPPPAPPLGAGFTLRFDPSLELSLTVDPATRVVTLGPAS